MLVLQELQVTWTDEDVRRKDYEVVELFGQGHAPDLQVLGSKSLGSVVAMLLVLDIGKIGAWVVFAADGREQRKRVEEASPLSLFEHLRMTTMCFAIVEGVSWRCVVSWST